MAANERRVFESASSYYCRHYHWPDDWDDLVDFADEQGRSVELLRTFKDAELSSPRAILLTLAYKQSDGTPRKVTFITPPRCGDAAGVSDQRMVSIAGGGITFRLPEGFSLMKGQAILERWKVAPYPDAAWSSKEGAIIAVRFGDVELDRRDVPDFLDAVSQAYEASVPSLVWKSREVRSIGGMSLLRHDFESSSRRGTLRTVVFSGSFDERLFAITVTGPAELSDWVTKSALAVEETMYVR